MLIKVLVLKLVETMLLYSGVGGEIGSGDGNAVELSAVTGILVMSEVSIKLPYIYTLEAMWGLVVVCVGVLAEVLKNVCFVIGNAYMILNLILVVDLILVILMLTFVI